MDDFFDLVQKYEGRDLLYYDFRYDRKDVNRFFQKELESLGWEVAWELRGSLIYEFVIYKEEESHRFRMATLTNGNTYPSFSWKYFLEHNRG